MNIKCVKLSTPPPPNNTVAVKVIREFQKTSQFKEFRSSR
jgi:hypothetical protein